VRSQQRFYALAEFRITAAPAVEDTCPRGNALLFHNFQEDGLNSLGIDGHGYTFFLAFPPNG
jgi:hypothetical protein